MATQTWPKRQAMEELKQPERFSVADKLTMAYWLKALTYVLSKIRSNIPTFKTKYPAPASHNKVYKAIANVEWTSSFWTGMLWLAYEASGESLFRKIAEDQLTDYRNRLDQRIHTDTHDLGFLYSLSCVAAYKLTGNREARATALKAADLLMTRYFEKAGIIQAWGDLSDPAQRGRMIVDCAMNLPLLYWATAETDNPYYRAAAIKHLGQMNTYALRPDWSSFHSYFFDVESGQPQYGQTVQGFSDSSCWTRGQAWSIYGNALSARYQADPSLLETARGLARYYLNRLPEDLVPYWDLHFTSGPEERDSSSAAIAVCGLLELAGQLPGADPERRIFENAAFASLASLSDHYTTKDFLRSNGLLLQAVYNKPAGHGVNECNIWGDYFYTEALVRLVRSWKPYW